MDSPRLVALSKQCLRPRALLKQQSGDCAGRNQCLTIQLKTQSASTFSLLALPKLERTFLMNSMVVAYHEVKCILTRVSVRALVISIRTTLLTAFRLHNETVTPKREVCVMTNPGTDEEIYDKMMNEIEPLAPGNANVKRGIKCPQGLASLLSIERLSRMFPDTKLVYGLRHPVMQFQSFYNYRVLSLYESGRRQDEQIPSAETLIEESWKLVSTKHTRFEETLKNLGKTNTTENLPSTPFKVFLYTIEQMHDSSEDRRLAFRNALGSFLGLEKSIPALPNSNHQSKSYDETIDICDSKYDEVRRVLVKNGKETQRWILEDFIHSPDVTVANKGHFHELLESFGIDPCLQSVE